MSITAFPFANLAIMKSFIKQKISVCNYIMFIFLEFTYFFNFNLFILGEVLRGDRIVNTAFNVQMAKNMSCRFLCNPVEVSKRDLKTLIERIRLDYSVHL